MNQSYVRTGTWQLLAELNNYTLITPVNYFHICHNTYFVIFATLSTHFCSIRYVPEIKHSRKLVVRYWKTLNAPQAFLCICLSFFTRFSFYKYAFINYLFGKLVFCFSVMFCIFCLFCFEFHVIFIYFETFIC